jgi:farnesyl-diphosphate farnesyltransferase
MSLQTYSKATSDPQNIAQGWLLDDSLPEVSRRIGEWIFYCPVDIRPRVIEATVAMSDRMANWAEVNWKINNESDLDAYTFSVAGAVGILLSDLWAWF